MIIRKNRCPLPVANLSNSRSPQPPLWSIRNYVTLRKKVKPLRILILGGTGFTGPFQVKYALSRGHKVTVFNRGKTHPGELPKEVEQLVGDSNGKLDALKGKQWDVCIDNPTTLPAWVRDAAQVLKGTSTVTFLFRPFRFMPIPTPVRTKHHRWRNTKAADPYKETLEAMKASGFKTYGPLKALSEQETEKWFPGKSLIIRPGLIVGPRDETDRFTYWPVRIDRGGEVLAPGDPRRSGAIHRWRDLAEWTIRMVENGETGIYNATGPAKELGVGGMLDGIKSALNSNATFTWADAEFLKQQKVEAWSDMPVWAGRRIRIVAHEYQSRTGERPDVSTAADTARGYAGVVQSATAGTTGEIAAGLTAEREAEVLTALHKSKMTKSE